MDSGGGEVSAAGEAKPREGRRRAIEQSPTRNGRVLASGSEEGEVTAEQGSKRRGHDAGQR